MLKVLIVLIKRTGTKKKTVYYMSVSGGLGMGFEIIPWLFAGLVCSKRIMHHHSYNYIYNKSIFMRIMQHFNTGSVVNIFLCKNHATSFLSVYKKIEVKNTRVVSNEFMARIHNINIEKRYTKTLVVGHLSNLTIEKGFLKVMEVFDEMVNEKEIIFKVAGPCIDKRVESAIKEYQGRFPEKFLYDGPVYDDEKELWYKGVDIFLFPTSYSNETYPLVITEALSHAVLPLTTNIACLPEINHIAFTSNKDNFVSFASNFIQKYSREIFFRAECQEKVQDLRVAMKQNIEKQKKLLMNEFFL